MNQLNDQQCVGLIDAVQALNGFDDREKLRQGYEKYKQSGVVSLGAVPAHWTVSAIKFALSMPITDGPHETPEFPLLGIPFVSAEAIKEDRIDFGKIRGFISPEDHARFSRKYVPKRGDVYMVKSGATTGNVARVETDAVFNIWSPLAVLRPHSDRTTTDFLFFFMKSRPFFTAVELAWSFGTQQNIGMGVISNIRIALPPLPEQRAIAAFLRRQTAKIDALVDKKRRLIDLLKEKRIALISHAVTKGLNPTAALRPSGVEWLGDVPAHWHCKRLKYLVIDGGIGIQMGPFGASLTDLSFVPTGFKVYGQENTINNDFSAGKRWLLKEQFDQLRRYEIKQGDLVLTRKGSIGQCQIVPGGIEPGIADSDTIRVRVNEKLISHQLLVLSLREAAYMQDQIFATKRGAILSGLNTQTIANLTVAVPPSDEQFQILGFIDAEERKLVRVVSSVESAIALLVEYRSALISAAVTGKINVSDEIGI